LHPYLKTGMKILILSQVYWPDNVAVSLFVSDLSWKLAESGHQVEVWSGQYPYEKSGEKYPPRESRSGVEIRRLRNTGLGKSNTLFRLFDFFTFNFLILAKLWRLPKRKYDWVIVSTVPPMLPFMAALMKNVKQYHLYYWIMDLQPELSIQSGMIRAGSILASGLTFMGDLVMRRSDHIAVLDRFMKDRVQQKSNKPERNISITPLWPVLKQHYDGHRLNNPFRQAHGWRDKVVVMYSGNHSYVHPVRTLLQTALRLASRPELLFVFIGEGVRKKEVTIFKEQNRLKNIVQLPFQPREKVHLSLAAADLQVVILGDGQVGNTHPNKIYGALAVGRPVVYIGPGPSHITDVLDKIPGNIKADHGQPEALAQKMMDLVKNRDQLDQVGRNNAAYARKNLDPIKLQTQMLSRMNQIFEQNNQYTYD